MCYLDALALQLRIVERVEAARGGDAVLILVEHEPVITLGRSAKEGHLRVAPEELARRGIELHKSNRGGDITYHGPGQIVGYPILYLPEGRRDIHRFLRTLEGAIIGALATFGIHGLRVPGLTGVWVGEAKIAAIGVAFRRWTSHHGFALNVTTDLAAFDLIVPCGIADRPVTSMAKLLGRAPPRAAVEDALVAAFCREFCLGPARECFSAAELLTAIAPL